MTCERSKQNRGRPKSNPDSSDEARLPSRHDDRGRSVEVAAMRREDARTVLDWRYEARR